MSRPLDVKIVAPVEVELHILALQLIDDRSIVDSLDWHALAVQPVVKLTAVFFDPGDVNSADTQHLSGERKIRKRLLTMGGNLNQNNIFRIMCAHNRAPQQVTVGMFIQ